MLTEPAKYRLIMAGGLIAIIVLLSLLKAVVIPILIAATLAYLLDPLVDWLEQLKLKRGNAVLLLTLVAVFLLTLLILLLFPLLKREVAIMTAKLPAYLESFKLKTLPVLESRLSAFLPGVNLELSSLFAEGKNLLEKVPPNLWQRLLKGFASTITGSLSLLVSIIGTLIIPLYLYYILLDFDSYKEKLLSLVPPKSRDILAERFRAVDEVLSAFLRGQAMVAAILSLLYCIGLALIGLETAIILGIFSGIAFVVPYVGTLLGLGLSALFAFLQFHDLAHPLYVLILYGIAQGLEGMVLTPKIVGEKVGLHPLAVIIAVITAGELFGFLGILLAVPAAATLKIFALPALESYKESSFFKAS